jgi:hypothetical protein
MDLSTTPKKSLVFGILALVLLLSVLVYVLGPAPEVPPSAVLPHISLETLLGKSGDAGKPEKQSPLALTWGRDPFALPPGIASAGEPAGDESHGETAVEEQATVRLTAILISGRTRLAVINERVVGVGDRVNQEEIISITPEQVILRGPFGRRVLPVALPQTKVKVHQAKEAVVGQ